MTEEGDEEKERKREGEILRLPGVQKN